MNSFRIPLAAGVLAAGIVLAGISFGAVAYFAGESPMGSRHAAPGPALSFVPASAGLIGHLDLRSVVASPLGEGFSREWKDRNPLGAFEELREATGVDLLADVDALTFSVSERQAKPGAPGQERWGVAASGSFDFDAVVGKLAENEGRVSKETHGGTVIHVLTAPVQGKGSERSTQPPSQFGVAHPEDSIVLLGEVGYLKEMLDTRSRGEEPAAGLLESWGYPGLDAETFWIAGNPPGFVGNVVGRGNEPSLRSFAITGRLESDVLLRATGKATDPQAAQKLADVARGFIALGRLREGTGGRAEALARIADSVTIDQVDEDIEIRLAMSYDTLRELMRQGRGSEAAAQSSAISPR